MADSTNASIVIDASPEVILAEIVAFESYPDWSSEITAAEVTERYPDGLPKEVYFAVAMGVVKAEYTLRYEYLEGNAGMSWKLIEGRNMKAFTGSYLLEQEGTSTRVTYAISVETPIPLVGFMKRQIQKRIVDVALKGLKKRVESQ